MANLTGLTCNPLPAETVRQYGFTHQVVLDFTGVALMTSGTAQAIFPGNALATATLTVPVGARVTAVMVNVATAFVFSPGTLVATIGDGNDAARFMASTTIKTAGYITDNALTKKPYIYTTADTIDITITAGAGALTSVTAGSLEIYLNIAYDETMRSGGQ